MLCAFVTSFSFSAYSLLLPAFIQEFHWAHGAAALLFVVHQVAAAVGPYASGLVFDATGTYRLAFFVLGLVMLLALLPAAFTQPAVGTPQPTRARPGASVARDRLS